jgi:hypothetical protein
MATLSIIWNQVIELLNDGISVIPIRDKEEETKGKKWNKKQPFGSWEKYQHKAASKEELWYLMEKYDTAAIATVCGKISGNMEAIDIDVKWHTTIAKQLFDEIKNVYPELFERIRIHRTPSGGFHILYRVDPLFTIPGNKKLASRQATDDELAADPKQKAKCFLETRGEGGYVAAPPSLGYEVVKSCPLPVLTIAERDSLINLCASFNEVLKEEGPKAPSQDSIYYDINPFESYNRSSAAERALTDNGWKFHSQNSRALYFTRPGSKSGGIHATFLFARRLYIFFSTNTEFDVDRCYKPATVLGKLQYNGDMKLLNTALKKDGYGVIKREIENKIVKRAVMAGEELPSNVSSEARVDYVAMKEQYVKVHPYGVFWAMGEKDAVEISRERLYTVCEGMGYRLYENRLHRIDGYLLVEKDLRSFYDEVKAYIQEEDGDLYIDICSSYEAFIEKHGEFTVSRMQIIDSDKVVTDTRDCCYKFYLNGYLCINASGLSFKEYTNVHGFVVANNIQPRNFKITDISGKYLEFLNLAVNYATKRLYIDRVLGYLCHNYKDEDTAFIIVLTEECSDPKHGGGSGKNVFTSLLKGSTSIGGVSGTQVKFDSAFLQAWNMKDKLFAIHDIPKKFDFLFLKELTGGSGVVKKLYEDEIALPVERMPKFIVSTNYSYEVTDGGLRRRIIPIEFTNFFTLCGGVNSHFGGMFPKCWTEEDWEGYDNLIANAICEWLKCGLNLEPVGLTAGGSLKQFDQTYWQATREFIELNFEKWVLDGWISNVDFNNQYEKFCIENMIDKRFRLTSFKLNAAIEDWCKAKEVIFVKDKVSKINGITTRGKEFLPAAPF